MIVLRNDLKIYLSPHPHDIITVFVILVKKDYGNVMRDSIVVDIGANIGVFSLYAACCGARKIYAYEPNHQAYEVLQCNIINNKLEEIIIPYKLAISSMDGAEVRIPIEASPYNRLLNKNTFEKSEKVKTVNLETLVSNIDFIDLLKMDCEGAEYDILFNSGDSVFSKIREIRMEYHKKPVDSLLLYLKRYKFHLNCLKSDSAVLWITKS